MDITPYVDSLRRDLLATAEAGGPEVAAAAERLGYALEPATRLALMEALSQAAAEITASMPAGGVDVRLDGRDLDFVVDAAPPAPPTPPAPPAPPRPEEVEEDANVARITLRLPESLKTRAEDAAAAAGSGAGCRLEAKLHSSNIAFLQFSILRFLIFYYYLFFIV